jgi:hypothetical protein
LDENRNDHLSSDLGVLPLKKKTTTMVFYLLFVLIFFSFAIYGQKNRSANNPNFIVNPYHPIMITWKNNDGVFSDGNVIGGFRGSKWFHLESFDITYKGKLLKPETFQKQYSNSVENKDFG